MRGTDVASAVGSPTAEPRAHAPLRTTETTAWLLALPIAALSAVVAALLAKPVGTLLFPPLQRSEVWRWESALVRPEPQEPGAYVLLLCAAALLTAAVLACAHRPVRLAPGSERLLAALAQLGTVGFL